MVVGSVISDLVPSGQLKLDSLPLLVELLRSYLLLERRLHNSILGGIVAKHFLAHLNELSRGLWRRAESAIHVHESLGAAVVLAVVKAAVCTVVAASVEHALVLFDQLDPIHADFDEIVADLDAKISNRPPLAANLIGHFPRDSDVAASGLIELLTLVGQLWLFMQQLLALHVVLVVGVSEVSVGPIGVDDFQIGQLRHR